MLFLKRSRIFYDVIIDFFIDNYVLALYTESLK